MIDNLKKKNLLFQKSREHRQFELEIIIKKNEANSTVTRPQLRQVTMKYSSVKNKSSKHRYFGSFRLQKRDLNNVDQEFECEEYNCEELS